MDFTNLKNMKIAFENNENTTATYYEVIEFYKNLDNFSPYIHVSEFGSTDSGYPLHEVVVSKNKSFDPGQAKADKKAVLFINNAIHPGEPCGVDATMMWIRDLVSNPQSIPEKVVIVAIPFYNIGGGLNRNAFSRANQVGPESYGFRGNAKNLDLNRDFIKCDSKNAQAFNQLFNKWSPDIMVDNHTSNGADYTYVMTLIATQKDKLPKPLKMQLTEKMLPFLYKKMESTGYEMTPYVYARSTPDEGIAGFLDLPRYSSGYAALHHTTSFMPETHMLKPYKDRVLSTKAFLEIMLDYVHENRIEIIENRRKARSEYNKNKMADIQWEMDRDAAEKLKFKGYRAEQKKSKVTGKDRLYYNHEHPYEKDVPFYNSYKASKSVRVPAQYIFPQAYTEIAERLEWNGVIIERQKKDESIEVEAYYIRDFENLEAYEGHYLHYNTSVEKKNIELKFRKGDFVINTDQQSLRYIIETLEPEAPDSYFSWNFFDGILMQKEYFSPYVFEDSAWKILQSDPGLKSEFERKKRSDVDFAADANAQLRFIYENSPHYEATHRRYPVYKVF